jgi:hypothetical protein
MFDMCAIESLDASSAHHKALIMEKQKGKLAKTY